MIDISYNQPKFDGCPTWNPNATTLANNSTVGIQPHGIFIDRKNTIYVANQQNGLIVIWHNATINSMKTINVSRAHMYSLFITDREGIYFSNYYSAYRISKLMNNTNNSSTVMYLESYCFGVFIDINDNLYCSVSYSHQVIAKSLNSDANMLSIVAGAGCCGSTVFMLCEQYGIFVDTNLDLYVADYGNNRIQRFHQGQLNATTVVGGGVYATTISLTRPSAVILDADKYLYIVDHWNHRIVGQGPNGFRCIVACNGGGSASDQLAYPMSLSFDSYGNLFVVDKDNHRIQKFVLASNSCSKSCKSRVTTIEIGFN